jgi:hypothetical protein
MEFLEPSELIALNSVPGPSAIEKIPWKKSHQRLMLFALEDKARQKVSIENGVL